VKFHPEGMKYINQVYEEMQLKELRRWIYKKQIKYINDRFKKSRKVDESKGESENTR